MRCTYCSTGYGSFGSARGHMSSGVWKRLAEAALAHVGNQRKLYFVFGSGESFLDIGGFFQFVDYTRSLAARLDVSVDISCTTNGTVTDQRDLEALADRGVGLCFSIDGPKPIHDRCRRTAEGKGSFDAAFNNWRTYNKLSRQSCLRPACNVQSVLTQHVRLQEIIDFWLEQDQRVFSCAIQLPCRFVRSYNEDRWREAQKRYLDDLRAFAMEKARVLSLPGFLSDYLGPADLYDMWKRFFMGTESAACGAGESVIAVDIRGDLYPCEAFIGAEGQSIGNLFNGIHWDRLSRFREKRHRAANFCQTCDIRIGCPKNCFGSDPLNDITRNFADGCSFARQVTAIASESYNVLAETWR